MIDMKYSNIVYKMEYMKICWLLKKILTSLSKFHSLSLDNYQIILYLPCSFRLWTIIALHEFVSFIALSNIWLLTIPPHSCSLIHLHKLIRYVTYCCPLPFLPSICPVSVRFSKPLSLLSQKFQLCKQNVLAFFAEEIHLPLKRPRACNC